MTRSALTLRARSDKVIEKVKAASFRVTVSMENVAGVKIPTFQPAKRETEGGRCCTAGPALHVALSSRPTASPVGLSKGGMQIAKCRDTFSKVLANLVTVASLQTSLLLIDAALKVTNRRVNALDFVVIPRIENTISYIVSELDVSHAALRCWSALLLNRQRICRSWSAKSSTGRATHRESGRTVSPRPCGY